MWRLSFPTENRLTLLDFSYFSVYRKVAIGRIRNVYSWQDDYIAALAELDPAKQRQCVYRAMAAIEQRRLSPIEPDSEEYQAIGRAERALEILKRGLPETGG